jgi:L-threonylcarbamoyladenylate synthase
LFIAKPAGKAAKNIFWLDACGNLHGAARRLFAQLRALDTAGYCRLHAEYASGQGLAEAINDRLRRAAAI